MEKPACSPTKSRLPHLALPPLTMLLTAALVLGGPLSAYGQFDNSATSPPANGGQPTTGTVSSSQTTNNGQTKASANPSAPGTAVEGYSGGSSVNSNASTGTNTGGGTAGVSATGGAGGGGTNYR